MRSMYHLNKYHLKLQVYKYQFSNLLEIFNVIYVSYSY